MTIKSFLCISGETREVPLGTEKPSACRLPPEYTVVPPIFADGKSASCPSSAVSRPVVCEDMDAFLQESEWLRNCCEEQSCDTWAGHHCKHAVPGQHIARSAILPVFKEKAQSISMMAHSMEISMKTTKLLNPTQV